MAEGFFNSFDPRIEAFSAGTEPADRVNPGAITVMKEIGIDISANIPEKVDKYIDQDFDYVFSVCGGAQSSCPSFTGNVKNNIHIGFFDPAEATGTPDEVLDCFRKVRDEIREKFYNFFLENIKGDI